MLTKTLHLTSAYHESSGGIRTMYEALLEHANREQRLMRLVVPGPKDGEQRIGRFGLIYYVRAPRAPFTDRRYRMLLPHRFLLPEYGRLWQIVKRESPDVLEVCDKYSLCYFAGLIRRRWRTDERPTLVGLSSERLDDNLLAYLPGPREPLKAWARTYLQRVYIGMFDGHIANSDYTAEELRLAMAPPHERPVHVCPMGVHVPPATMPDVWADARRELIDRCGGDEQPVVIYAGRLAPEKNVSVFPDIAAALLKRGARVHFVFAGDGPSRAHLQARFQATAPGWAHFFGHVQEREKLRRYVASSDIFLHPNPCEPFGIAPLEAMAAGTPVVAPNAGGVRSYATEDNAWLTRADPDGFAEAIRAALADRPERMRRLCNAQQSARGFSWPLAAARIFETYDRLHRRRSGLRLPPQQLRRPPAYPVTASGRALSSRLSAMHGSRHELSRNGWSAISRER